MTQQVALLRKMYSTSASTATAVMIEQDEQQQQQHQPVNAFQAYHHHLAHPGEQYARRVTAAAVPSPFLPPPLPPPPPTSSSQSHANSPIPYDSSTLYYNEEQETQDLLVSWNFADLGLEIPKDDEDEGEEGEEEAAGTASPPAVDSAAFSAVPVTPSESSTNSADSINGSSNNKDTKKLQQQQKPESLVPHKCINSFRRAGKKKPHGAPKRPLSAYNIFFKNERPKVLHEMLPGTVSFEQLGKLIGERWRALDQDQRKIYEQHAYKDVLRYRKQMDHFEDIRRQRFRGQSYPYPPSTPPQKQQQHQHPVVVSYDRNMMDNNNDTLPCVVSFEEALQAAANTPLPIIHDAPPPLYQLPPSTDVQQQRDCRTPSCSPEPTSTTTMISPYRITSCLSTTVTVTSTTAGYTKGGGDQAQAHAPPVTPPTPRPVVQQQQQHQTIHASPPHSPHHRQGASNSMLDPISLKDDDDDSPAAVYSYSYYPNYSNCSSSQYQYPASPRQHFLSHLHPEEEQHQLVLPKPPGRCLGGPPEHIAIPQGMDVYLPTTRTVLIPSLAASSTSAATLNHGQHDKSNNYHHHHHGQKNQQQQLIITGKRKYKVYYSAYRMKRSEADDYLKRLSDTLASWNTSVSATMASPTDSFVLNDDDVTTTNHHDVETTTTTNRETIISVAATSVTAPPHSPRPPRMPPTSHGGAGAGPSGAGPSGCVPYYPHNHENNSHNYGEMRHNPRRYL